jgi:cytochrome b561
VAAIRFIEFGRRAHARSWDFALLVCSVGIVGLIHDSWPKSAQGPWINLHVVFGLLLWILVVAQFQHARSASLINGANLHSFCRQLSRAVYFLLYILFGANQIVRAGVFLWNRGTWGALHPAILQPPENLRDYLAYGIFALLTIRALAVLQSHMLKHGGLPHGFPTTNTTNESAISAGRGRGCAAVAGAAGPKSAVTR